VTTSATSIETPITARYEIRMGGRNAPACLSRKNPGTTAAIATKVPKRRELRTATEASRTDRQAGTLAPAPSSPPPRIREAIWRTSLTASSITMPRAITKPATSITFSVTSRRMRIAAAAANEEMTAAAAITIERHSNRSRASAAIRRRPPIASATATLRVDVST
jgi:hypothetical protein